MLLFSPFLNKTKKKTQKINSKVYKQQTYTHTTTTTTWSSSFSTRETKLKKKKVQKQPRYRNKHRTNIKWSRVLGTSQPWLKEISDEDLEHTSDRACHRERNRQNTWRIRSRSRTRAAGPSMTVPVCHESPTKLISNTIMWPAMLEIQFLHYHSSVYSTLYSKLPNFVDINVLIKLKSYPSTPQPFPHAATCRL